MPLPRVVLITGANSGIGYETVKAFLESARSYHILLGARSLEKGKEAIATLQREYPNSRNTIEGIQVDLANDDSIEKAYEQVKASLGRLDCLINNAGMYCVSLPITFN